MGTTSLANEEKGLAHLFYLGKFSFDELGGFDLADLEPGAFLRQLGSD